MHIERLTRLKQFFDDGAPHFVLDMRHEYSDIHYYRGDEEVPNGCGSAGCIAGAAIHLFVKNPDPDPDWYWTCHRARGLLGLPTEVGPFHYGHALFNPRLAPPRCTAAQAAQAIQNVIEGKDPWT